MEKMRSMSTGTGSWLSAILVCMCMALGFGAFPGAVNADSTVIITDSNVSNIEQTITEAVQQEDCDGQPANVKQIKITFGPLSMDTDIAGTNTSGGEAEYTVELVSHTALKLEIPGTVPLIVLEATLPNQTGQDTGLPGPSPSGNWIWNLGPGDTVAAPNALVTTAAALPQIILNPGDPNFDFFVGAGTFNVTLTSEASVSEDKPGTWDGNNVTQSSGTMTIEYICESPPPPPPGVPTFTEWGIIGLSLLLAASGMWLIRRRRSMS